MNRILIILGFSFLASCGTEAETSSDANSAEFSWLPFDNEVFKMAQNENKLVLLDIGANWCHWCHVMDEKTYNDKEVQEFLSANFILAREDQDSRPDLYAAYRNWGWPAIIVFNAQKEEVLRLKGYQEKNKFLKILEKTIADPQPLSNEPTIASKLNATSQELYDRFLSRIDHQKGMYNANHKYIQLPGIEHGLKYYNENDSLKKWVDMTIAYSYNLVDPVWSGVYQYSTKKGWVNQHYEKLLRVQANYIEAYARYGMVAKNDKAIEKAEEIFEYCERFLGNESPLYYNSQNADVVEGEPSDDYYSKTEEERLKIGTPSVDQNIYLKENAMMIKSLVYLWAGTNNDNYLNRAIKMCLYIPENFNDFNDLYNRSESGAPIYSLEDNRELLEAVMILYQATGDDRFYKLSSNIGGAIIKQFDDPNGMISSTNTEIARVIVPENNLDAAINYNYLGHLIWDKKRNESFFKQAKKTYSKLDQVSMSERTPNLPNLLRAEDELNQEPYHAVFITDGKDEELGREFYKMILANPNQYTIFERAVIGKFRKDQELLYSETPSGTLFMCTSTYCSAPITSKIGLQEFLESN